MREQGLGVHQGQAPMPPGAPPSGGAAPSGREAPPMQRLFYWPAYEMVKEGFEQPYLDDGRHVRPEVVRQILELFGKYYVPPPDAPPAADPAGHADPAGPAAEGDAELAGGNAN